MSLCSLESIYTGVFLLDVYFGLKIGGQKIADQQKYDTGEATGRVELV